MSTVSTCSCVFEAYRFEACAVCLNVYFMCLRLLLDVHASKSRHKDVFLCSVLIAYVFLTSFVSLNVNGK